VKSLGEVHEDPDNPAGKVRDWKETKAAHLDTGYKLLSVPRGVDFLTMMVDVQGNRFEAGVWGWSRNRECWLIDRFAIKQRLGPEGDCTGRTVRGLGRARDRAGLHLSAAGRIRPSI
jgi:phage terminase large subunit GpA-like protein